MRIPGRDPGRPELRIDKTCERPTDLGAPVSCRITVTSAGTAAPTGPVRVNDAATVIGTGTPVQILTVTPDGAEWACGPVPADALSCQIPGAVMTPGTSRHFDVTVQAPTYGRFENCARGNWGPAPGNDIVYPFGEACAEGGSLPHRSTSRRRAIWSAGRRALHLRDHDHQWRHERLLRPRPHR